MAQIKQADDEDIFVDELRPGTKLLQGQYTIERFINAGGFGITYLAKNSLDRDVVIKECFPGSFCRRTQNIVAARSRAHESQFAQIVKLFVQEAKSLSRLVHPSIIGVHQVFEDNDTAYMAIDFVDGRDLLEIIETDRARLTPGHIMSMLKKLLGAVAFIHDNGMLHRDISPDNILVNGAGEPILIDFGAARQQATKIGGKAMSALRVVKDGYSPQEFYVSGSVQNASSDLYALAATFYHAITGTVPPDSQVRLMSIAEGGDDPYVPLAGRFDEYPASFLEALDQAARVLPRDRIVSARDWLDRIITKQEMKVVHLNAQDSVKNGATVTGAAVDHDEDAAAASTGATEAQDVAESASASVLPSLPAPEDEAPKKPGRGKMGLMLSAAAIVVAGLGYAVLQSGGGDNVETQAPEVPAPIVVAEAAPAAAEPAATEAEPAATEAGPAATEAGPAATEAGTAATEAEPAATEAGPAATEAEPAATEAGPAATEAGPAATEAGPAATEAGPAATEDVAVAAPEPAAPDAADPAEATESAEVNTGAIAVDQTLQSEPEAAVAGTEAETIEAPAEEAVVEQSPAKPVAEPQQAEESATAPTIVQQPDPAVASLQILLAEWEVILPFRSETTTSGGRFPRIVEVISVSGDSNMNAWVAEGVTIYAVNGTWVADQQSIENLIKASAESGNDQFAFAPARVKTDPTAPFSEVTLAALVTHHVTLANGVEFHTTSLDGSWQTSVTEVAEEVEDGFRVGDIIRTENTTGEVIRSAHSLETVLNRIARAKWPDAIFTVEREGASTVVVMALARTQ